MIIVDAHEDLAYNALADGRDYRLSAYATRADEAGGPVPDLNGQCMLGLPEWLQANVALIFATITTIPRKMARVGEMSYPNIEASYQQALAQLNIYHQWTASHPQLKLVTHKQQLEELLQSYSETAVQLPDKKEVGFILLMENADPIRQPIDVEFWHRQGLRLIGPAWHSNRYTGSTKDPGPLTDLGRQLLVEMQKHQFILDISHMADEACLEALDSYEAPVVATHANPRRLVSMNRMLPDAIINRIVSRKGVIGIMPANWALDPTWPKHRIKDNVPLSTVVNAIDIICEIAGDAHHVGIGTDFDGGFGAASVPSGLDTIADLPKLGHELSKRGYKDEDIKCIMGENWFRILLEALPEVKVI